MMKQSEIEAMKRCIAARMAEESLAESLLDRLRQLFLSYGVFSAEDVDFIAKDIVNAVMYGDEEPRELTKMELAHRLVENRMCKEFEWDPRYDNWQT